jgi:hypothetical protein
MHGDEASASFFAPWDRNVEPYIRIATGDYAKLRARRGRERALAAYICSLAHEVIHYNQWIATGDTWERDTGRKSLAYLRKYSKAVAWWNSKEKKPR